MTLPKIRAVLFIVNSARDRSGNRYWYFVWINTITGKRVEGKFSGDQSNLYGMLTFANVPSDSVAISQQELSKRTFKYLSPETYAGCAPGELWKYIVDNGGWTF